MAVDMKNLTPRQSAAFHFICDRYGTLLFSSRTITQDQLIEILADFADDQAISAYDSHEFYGYDFKDNGNQGS